MLHKYNHAVVVVLLLSPPSYFVQIVEYLSVFPIAAMFQEDDSSACTWLPMTHGAIVVLNHDLGKLCVSPIAAIVAWCARPFISDL